MSKEKHCRFCGRLLGKRKGEEGIASFEKSKIVFRCLYNCKPKINTYFESLNNGE